MDFNLNKIKGANIAFFTVTGVKLQGEVKDIYFYQNAALIAIDGGEKGFSIINFDKVVSFSYVQ